MDHQYDHLVDHLVQLSVKSTGGWPKGSRSASITVTSEVLLALFEYFSLTPTPSAADDLKRQALREAVIDSGARFIVDAVKNRSKSDQLDATNCSLALAAYLAHRLHLIRRGQALRDLDLEFVESCIVAFWRDPPTNDSQLGLRWAVIKAFSDVDRFLSDPADDEFKKLGHHQFDTTAGKITIQQTISLCETLRTWTLSQGNALPGDTYRTSVVLDLSLTSGDSLFAAASSGDVRRVRDASLRAILDTLAPCPPSTPFPLNLLKPREREVTYEVVTSASLLSSLGTVLEKALFEERDEALVRRLFYSLANSVISSNLKVAQPFEVAHNLRALMRLQLAERDATSAMKLLQAEEQLENRVTIFENSSAESLQEVSVVLGQPGGRLFFACSATVLFILCLVYGVIFYTVSTSVKFDADNVALIAAALGLAFTFTLPGFVFFSRVNKFSEKSLPEKALLLVQYFTNGGWIGILIFVAYIMDWIPKILDQPPT